MATFPTKHLPATDGQAQLSKVFTSFAAINNLRTQSGYPNHCPQKLRVLVDAAGAGNLIYKDFAGNSNTIALANSDVHDVECATTTIEISTIAGTIVAYWWCDSATVLNP